MSLGRCLDQLIAAKTISAERGAAMRGVYDELIAQYEPRFGRAAAESMATEKAMAAIEADATHRRLNVMRQVKAQQVIADNASRLYRNNGTPGKPSPDGLLAHLVDDQHAPYGNVEYRWKNIRDSAMRMMYDALRQHRANLIGEMRNPADFDDVVMALGGRDMGANAREIADSWLKTSEYLRAGYNAAGGRIAKLEGWSLPHQWDGVKTGLVPYETWRADMIGELDRAGMIDRTTGEPMSDFRIDDVLRQSYEGIVSDGAVGREASGAVAGTSIANRRQEHRVLHFATPEGWLRMNAKYGASNPFEAMIHHVDSMSRDIAAMQILGPNPAATVRWMQDLVGITALTSPRLTARFGAGFQKRKIEHIWNEITGMNRVAARPNIALFFSTIRNWQSATKLGSATINSVADIATQGLTARFNGLPATKAIGTFLNEYNPLDGSHREFARRAMIIQDEMIGRAAGFGRQHFENVQGGALTAPSFDAFREGRISLGDYLALQMRSKLQAANEISRRASEGVMRVSLLNGWTMFNREATTMEFWNGITHHADTSFGELNGGFRGFLQRYGIDGERWDVLRATPRTEHGGAQWILPDAIADADVRNRIVEGIFTELDYAVTTGGIRQRANMTVGRPGELPHEIVKTLGQFLMFPITVTSRHAARAFSLSTVGTKAGYATAFLAATTLMGALAEQLNQISRGRDPRPMGNRKFVMKAISRGGGVGYYGDIFEHTVAENGRGLSDLGNAPILGSAENWANLAVRQPYRAATGQKTNFPRAVDRIARYETPGDNIWYLRLAYERLLLDSLSEMGDGHPGESYRRLARRAEEEGTEYWAPPGSGIHNMRAPDWSNAFSSSSARSAKDAPVR